MGNSDFPKLARLREMREANFERAAADSKKAKRDQLDPLREKIAAVPVQKPKKKKDARRK